MGILGGFGGLGTPSCCLACQMNIRAVSDLWLIVAKLQTEVELLKVAHPPAEKKRESGWYWVRFSHIAPVGSGVYYFNSETGRIRGESADKVEFLSERLEPPK